MAGNFILSPLPRYAWPMSTARREASGSGRARCPRRDAFPPLGHDHARCVEDALRDARQVCEARRLRLTPLRERVLEIIWQDHRPLGAYAILGTLAGEGRAPAPPTVYRALDFLLEHGLVHRIASLNAFVGCAHPGHPGISQFLICRGCGDAEELNDPGIERAIGRSTSARGFSAHHHTIEVSGLCRNCAD